MQAGTILPDPFETGAFVEAIRLDRQPNWLLSTMAGVAMVVPSGFQQKPIGSYVHTHRNEDGTRVLARSYVLTQNWSSQFSVDILSITTWSAPGSGRVTVQYNAGQFGVVRSFTESTMFGGHIEAFVSLMGHELDDAVRTMRSIS